MRPVLQTIMLLSVLLCSCAAFAQSAEETWGAQHARLETTSEGASLELDCASGRLSQPVTPDSAGHFSVPGTFTQEHPGPVRAGENSSVPATYVGTIQGSKMQLSIVLDQSKQTVGTFELERGSRGKVFKCR